ncbi:MAG TPA: type II restriction endonuclease, partial [Aurantimonas coralicida]|nr:type II restriction endonuclease [Aurantimonas coralicida]
MPVMPIEEWIEEHSSEGDAIWYVKRLSGNDTGLTGGHQVGIYVPRPIAFELFPAIDTVDKKNPRQNFDLMIDSHPASDVSQAKVVAIYYNARRVPGETGTRNEVRITRFGGRQSPFQDVDNTSALTALVFRAGKDGQVRANAWVCESVEEEDAIEGLVGPIDPGKAVRWSRQQPVGPLFGRLTRGTAPAAPVGRMSREEIPAAWINNFPSGQEIVDKTVELFPGTGLDPDKRLVRRRDVEWEIFQSIERAGSMETVARGFEQFEEFLKFANSVMQRRKSRSGNSLEFHVRHILGEEGL